ncbi:hypothetical protein QWY31_08145 [Cytophagales bacterium LB-30]|uniref:Uncharacterized protein n=1 Tax=Shiella aurantiaca TaxID=3058365 RepID=A0ABT8F4U4_9BACT|nr:hypothetical protein [Shiella aurantiaca]MDN4165467.1 hypothetical protein [Shiella aurantiaca]
MLEWIKNTILQFNEITSLHIHTYPDGQVVYYGCTVKKKGDEILITSSFEHTDISKTVGAIPVNKPIYLTIDGRGVLHKQVVTRPIKIENVLPQTKLQDFYIQQYLEEGRDYISLIRKETLNSILSPFANFYIAGIYLGPFSVLSHSDWLLNSERSIQTIGVKIGSIDLQKNLEFNQQRPSGSFQLGDETYPNASLIPFATALLHWFNKNTIQFIGNESYNLLAHNALDKILAKKFSRWALLILFTIAFSNALFYMSNHSQYQESYFEFQSFQEIYQQHAQLTKEIEEIERFRQVVGFRTSETPFFYRIDQIAHSVPSEISLTSLTLHPLDPIAKQRDRKLAFKSNTVVIKGACSNALYVNKWIETLEDMPWVTTVSGSKYKYDSFKQIGIFEFTLLVKP